MSICNGVEAIQARYLRSAGSQTHHLDVMGLLTDQRARIELNWELSPRLLEGKRPSAENWRLERRPHLAAHNASPEKTLEKAIARQAHWYNQIPTASGLYHHRRDKLRNIDLVRAHDDGSYTLVELKVRSNSPLEATLELLIYVSLYEVARRRYLEEERAAKALLQATELHWRAGRGTDRSQDQPVHAPRRIPRSRPSTSPSPSRSAEAGAPGTAPHC